jgi:HD-GYP domain-containing protein (c-di-GMP phosphodiesterase class II)
VNEQLASEQALRYAEELRQLHADERTQRRRAEEAFRQLAASYASTVRALAATLELRDDVSGDHAERVASLALQFTQRVAPRLADEPTLEYGFLLHDLGKIGVPDAVLLKPGRLEDAEFEQMRRHTVLGEEILAHVPYLSEVAREVIGSHHERWDGNGYPRGLAAEEIPLPARIFALVDAYDAMTNDRPYRDAIPYEEARRELVAGAGRQFDPALTEAFVELVDELRSTA